MPGDCCPTTAPPCVSSVTSQVYRKLSPSDPGSGTLATASMTAIPVTGSMCVAGPELMTATGWTWVTVMLVESVADSPLESVTVTVTG